MKISMHQYRRLVEGLTEQYMASLSDQDCRDIVSNDFAESLVRDFTAEQLCEEYIKMVGQLPVDYESGVSV